MSFSLDLHTTTLSSGITGGPDGLLFSGRYSSGNVRALLLSRSSDPEFPANGPSHFFSKDHALERPSATSVGMMLVIP
jgi:hypothetical protein